MMKKNYILFLYSAAIIVASTMTSCSDEDSKWGKPLEEAITISTIEIHQTDHDVNNEEICMLTNTELQLSYTLLPKTATNQKVTWTSSDETIVSITQDGKLTSTSKCGDAIIRISPEIGNNTAPVRTVKVVDHYNFIETITITNIPTEEIAAGSEYPLKIIAAPENATFKCYKFESSHPEIATVDDNGVIKGLSKGEVTITVTANDLNPQPLAPTTFKVKFREIIPIEGIEFINDPELTQLGYDQAYQINYQLEPEDATSSLLTWESDNKDVISVDKKGKLKVHSMTKGSATITATYGPISKSVTVSIAEGRFYYSFANGIPSPWTFDPSQSSKSKATSDGEKTTVIMEKKGENKYRGDLNLTTTLTKKALIISPGEYRYLAIKFRPSIVLQSSGKGGGIILELFDNNTETIGGSYLGPGNKTDSNSYIILDAVELSTTSPNIIYYDLQGPYKTKTPTDFTHNFNLVSFKLKIPDWTSDNYDIYWMQTFKTVDDLRTYVTNEKSNQGE